MRAKHVLLTMRSVNGANNELARPVGFVAAVSGAWARIVVTGRKRPEQPGVAAGSRPLQ